MRRLILYSAVSSNGFIARPDGSVDWLEAIPNPDQLDFGYAEFYASIGVTLQGASTYRQLLAWDIDFPYAEKENYVFTRGNDLKDTEHVTIVREDPAAFVRRLKERAGPDIWLVGGGQINGLLLAAGLVDEIQLFVMPIALPDGLPLFGRLEKDIPLRLRAAHTYPTGVLRLIYGEPGLLIRTTAQNKDFVALVQQLDAHLAITDGDEHAFYDQYNKLGNIHHVILLYREGKAIACGAIKIFSEKRMEVKRMFTLPEYRGRGLARQILGTLENWAAEMGFPEVILETGVRQPDAIALYEKAGYERIENYGPYEGVENSVCFGKSLR